MSRDWRLPAGVSHSATASIVGILTTQPSTTTICGEQKKVAVTTVVAGERSFDVTGYGDIADALSVIPAGTVVMIEGTLEQNGWEVGSGQKRNKLFVVVESVKSLCRAERVE